MRRKPKPPVRAVVKRHSDGPVRYKPQQVPFEFNGFHLWALIILALFLLSSFGW
jgi:hypothetical protein